jgi:hypothetical protein
MIFLSLQVVPPGANTTFDVVFLARQLGNVENTLYIHTSQGTFRYQVSLPPYHFEIGLISDNFSRILRILNSSIEYQQVKEKGLILLSFCGFASAMGKDP